jgi:hypothetical protein
LACYSIPQLPLRMASLRQMLTLQQSTASPVHVNPGRDSDRTSRKPKLILPWSARSSTAACAAGVAGLRFLLLRLARDDRKPGLHWLVTARTTRSLSVTLFYSSGDCWGGPLAAIGPVQLLRSFCCQVNTRKSLDWQVFQGTDTIELLERVCALSLSPDTATSTARHYGTFACTAVLAALASYV